MNNIFLIRHGQDADNAAGILNGKRDTKLTSLGRKQANQVAQKLNNKNIKIIYTSPLKRAYETALIISKKLHVNRIVKCPLLIERDFGVLTGKPKTEIHKYSKKILLVGRVKYFLKVARSEDFPSLYARAKDAVEIIQEGKIMGNVLIVSHGDIGKMIIAVSRGWKWKKGLLTIPYLCNTCIVKLGQKEQG
jgi:broad specificity phosphatase PhoE